MKLTHSIYLVIFSLVISALAVSPAGFSKIKTLDGISEYRLNDNGLTVLLLEDHSAPVTTFMVTYRVGSKNEVTGTTGATHLLEHLMFKGTKKYNKQNGGHIDNLLGNIGARLNASTWNDRTNYFEIIPKDYLELAIDIESDRMRNLRLRPEDKDAEMTVVRNEYERGENSPFSALDKVIWASAYEAHPYHHSTIGWRSDIENVPVPKLRAFYNTFYWPNNATVTIIGDFEPEMALKLVKKYYGAIPSSPEPIPQLYTTEPKQEGPRRVIVKRPGQLGVVGVGWKAPEGLNDDTYALTILDKILSQGKSSRFYKALIDPNKAVNVFNYYVPFQDPGMFIPYAFLAPGVTHQEVEKIIHQEIDKIKKDGVSKEEVQRAINQVAAETAYGRDGSFSIARQINEAIAMGDWTFYTTYKQNINKVTPADVKNVVSKYFNEDQSTTGWFIPKKPGGDGSRPAAANFQMPDTRQYYRGSSNTNAAQPSFNAMAPAVNPKKNMLSQRITRQKIAGIDILTARTGVKDVVTFRGSLPAGDLFNESGNNMVADLTGRMLDKGTLINDKFALAARMENMGARISFGVGKYNLSINGRCLKKDAGKVIALMAEQLRQPAFDAKEFEKLKKQRVGNLKQQLDNTNSRASEKLKDKIFSKNHPNYETPIEQSIADIEKVTLADVRAFHKKYYGPKSMILVFTGDTDIDALQSDIKKSFKGWKGGTSYMHTKRETKKGDGKIYGVSMPGKTSASVTIGNATGLKRTDKDYLPFYLGNTIFGTGFAGRLMSIIRDDEGLTYGIYSSHAGDIYADGYWFIGATFAPNLLDKGLTSTRRELNRWVEKGVTQKELDKVKTRIKGRFKVGLATSAGMAGQILSIAQRGMPMEYLDEYPALIDAVTLDQVNEAIHKYVHPKQAVTVVAGNVDKDGKPLTKK